MWQKVDKSTSLSLSRAHAYTHTHTHTEYRPAESGNNSQNVLECNQLCYVTSQFHHPAGSTLLPPHQYDLTPSHSPHTVPHLMMYLPHCPLLLLTAKQNMTITNTQCTYPYLLPVTFNYLCFFLLPTAEQECFQFHLTEPFFSHNFLYFSIKINKFDTKRK
jgi:hypothetical protein